MWHDSANSTNYRNFNALTDCSIVLYVMAERWLHSKKYRDLFEAVKDCALQAMEEGKHAKETSAELMRDDIQSSLRSLPIDATMELISDDLTHMISDMAGQPVCFWQDPEAGLGCQGEVPTAFPHLGDDGFRQQWDSIDFANWNEFGHAAS